MCLEIKSGPFYFPDETTKMNNLNAYVFLYLLWENREFLHVIFHLIKIQPRLLVEIPKYDRNSGNILHSRVREKYIMWKLRCFRTDE